MVVGRSRNVLTDRMNDGLIDLHTDKLFLFNVANAALDTVDDEALVHNVSLIIYSVYSVNSLVLLF